MDTAASELPEATPTFGELLRRYRLAASISQERLAERAGLSVQALSALENGRRQAPYRHTVTLLAQALGLAADETALLEAAVVRGRMPAAVTPTADGQDREITPEPQVGADTAPGARAAQPARTNLPLALTSFIGRAREQAQVQTLLGAARLVTLTGAGGAGKTRLAMAVAEELVSEYADGVWLVELAPLADPALVAGVVAQALGLREEPGRPVLAVLADHLKERCLLLVLDNCEHLVGACAEMAEMLLRACPHLRILATSRETLEVPGEATYRVPSLAVPDLMHLPDLQQLAAYEAVALFLQRAQSRAANFTLYAENARAVASVCVRLDGMPLAIELAAARVSSLPVEAIAARLDDRFKLLTGGPRTAVPRQQTLRATLDWSHDLLSKPEQLLLHRLSVFAGGCTLEAAEAVCGGAGIEPGAVLDLLGGLVNKSLVLLEEVGPERGQGRYWLLETVRQYGQERLESWQDAATVREWHASYYLALAEEAEPHLAGQEQWAWRARLATEQDNLRAAVRWFLGRGAADEVLRLAVALDTFWMGREGYAEGKVSLEQALALPGAASSRARTKALARFGWGLVGRGDAVAARRLLEDCLMRGRELEDRPAMARALVGLGMLATHQGDLPRARALLEESLVACRAASDWWALAHAICDLARVVNREGDHARAHSLLDEALALAQTTGERQMVADVLVIRGEVAFAVGDCAEASRLWEEGLSRYNQLGLIMGGSLVENCLGQLALRTADYENARARFRSSLDHQRGWLYWAIRPLAGLAVVAVANGQAELALRLAGAVNAVAEAAVHRLPATEQAVLEGAIAAARTALDVHAASAAWAAGRAMTLAEAIALALEDAGAVRHEQ
jgi:non-specific serine/threonine protein kinase